MGSPNSALTAAVSSVDSSSTTMISSPSMTLVRAERTARGTRWARLWVGITTLTDDSLIDVSPDEIGRPCLSYRYAASHGFLYPLCPVEDSAPIVCYHSGQMGVARCA